MRPAFPLLTRIWRTQWRDARAFALLLGVVGALAALLAWRYGVEARELSALARQMRLRAVGEALWRQSAWLQTLVALLIAPALTAGAIARERERGLLEALQMAPLSPLQIALEKWLGALAPVLIVLGALFPLNLILVMSGGAAPRELLALTAFQIACAAGAAAIGLGCSAWARRTHLALRSAYSFIVLWLVGSGAAAIAANEGPVFLPGARMPFYVAWWGRTNPLFAANDLVAGNDFVAKWPWATLVLCVATLFCLWTATRALRRPLSEEHFISIKRRPSANGVAATPPGFFEVPLVGALRFGNPVMGREVRSKFRLRQPPLVVLLIEGLLALAVAFFYARTLIVALTDAGARPIIFWGISFTGLAVTMAACGIMGANALAREHEDKNWDNLRLSLLRPRALIGGKAGGILLTCALFSLPVWPLLLACVSWRPRFLPMPYSGQIAPSLLVAVFVVWLGSMLGATMWSLWLGGRARKTNAAVSLALGTGACWLVGGPIVESWMPRSTFFWSALNPFLALASASDAQWPISFALATGAPYLAAMAVLSGLLWAALEWSLRRDFGSEADA